MKIITLLKNKLKIFFALLLIFIICQSNYINALDLSMKNTILIKAIGKANRAKQIN